MGRTKSFLYAALGVLILVSIKTEIASAQFLDAFATSSCRYEKICAVGIQYSSPAGFFSRRDALAVVTVEIPGEREEAVFACGRGDNIQYTTSSGDRYGKGWFQERKEYVFRLYNQYGECPQGRFDDFGRGWAPRSTIVVKRQGARLY